MTEAPHSHLAQFNWATLRYDPSDPRVAEFIENVARMNMLAERIPGFVWRHLNDRAALKRLSEPLPFRRGKRFTTTLSVWRDLEALETYAFQTLHKRFLAKRAEWFLPPDGPCLVLWHVPIGHHPTIAEAVARAARLVAEGDGPDAFGWAYARNLARAPA